jgi:hypothetical protein
LIAGMLSRSIAAVCHWPTPAISFTASSTDNLSTIPLMSAFAKSEGGMAAGTLLIRDQQEQVSHSKYSRLQPHRVLPYATI